MVMQIRFLMRLTSCVAAVSLPLFSQAQMSGQSLPMSQAEPTQAAPARAPQSNFEGRGVAHGSVFTRGRNVTVRLTVERGNFTLNLAEPPGNRARVQYRGSIIRQNTTLPNSNSFTLDGRVQTFDSSASTRILNNTTGTCRIEVFDARVISSSCRTVAAKSDTQFLGLEQF